MVMTTDGQLVRRSLHGDSEAFGDLVDRYRQMVYGLAYHLTGEFEAARDLAQESFIQAYLKLDQLRDPNRFAGWLRQIVVNVRRMEHRRQKINTVALEEDAEPVTQPDGPSEVEVLVREALGQLREPDRLALTLHYIDGYSYTDIAGFLAVRPETVKTRLARARGRLREEIRAMAEDLFQNRPLPDGFAEKTVREAESRYLQAWAVHEGGKTDEAARTMTRMLRKDIPPDVRVRIHNNLGSFYHDTLGDPEKGREHFRLAAETADSSQMTPLNFFHWRVYAWVALRDHQWLEALDAASHVIDNAPTDFERRNLHVLIAAAAANLDQPEEALNHLKAASKPAPEPPDAGNWPFQVPPETDRLDWARKSRAEYFSSLADDPRFSETIESV